MLRTDERRRRDLVMNLNTNGKQVLVPIESHRAFVRYDETQPMLSILLLQS